MRKHLFLCALGGVVLPAFAASIAKASSVYVAETYTDSVAVIDTASDTVIHHIPVGDGPAGVAANGAETRVYVGLSGGSVAVIDATSDTVIKTVEVGSSPASLAYNQVLNRLYVADGNGITVIDAGSNKVVDTITGIGRVGLCSCIAVSRGGDRLYVADDEISGLGGYIHVIDTATDQILKGVYVSPNVSGVALANDDRYLYTSDWPVSGGPEYTATLRILDPTDYSLSVFAWPGDGAGSSVLPSTNGAHLYAPSFGSLVIIDLATAERTPLYLASSGQGVADYSYGVGFSPADNKLYVAASAFNAVSVVDTVKAQYLGAITVGYFPNGLVVLTGGVIFHGNFE